MLIFRQTVFERLEDLLKFHMGLVGNLQHSLP
jgi:hypothetical protein